MKRSVSNTGRLNLLSTKIPRSFSADLLSSRSAPGAWGYFSLVHIALGFVGFPEISPTCWDPSEQQQSTLVPVSVIPPSFASAKLLKEQFYPFISLSLQFSIPSSKSPMNTLNNTETSIEPWGTLLANGLQFDSVSSSPIIEGNQVA